MILRFDSSHGKVGGGSVCIKKTQQRDVTGDVGCNCHEGFSLHNLSPSAVHGHLE